MNFFQGFILDLKSYTWDFEQQGSCTMQSTGRSHGACNVHYHKTPFSWNEDQCINTRSNQHNILVKWVWQRDDTTLSSHPISICRRGCLARAKQWQHLPSASAPSPPPSLPVPLPLLGQFICSKIESKSPLPLLNNSLLLLGSDKTLIKAVVAPLKPAGACCRFGP